MTNDPREARTTLHPTELKLSDTCNVQFWTMQSRKERYLAGGIRTEIVTTYYHSRVDEKNAGIAAGIVVMHRPLAFHAAISAFSSILRMYHTPLNKLEGTDTQVIDPKRLLRTWADIYEVDIDQLAQHYKEARKLLFHPRLVHPATLESVFWQIVGKQKRKLH